MVADCFALIVNNMLSGGGGRREGWRRFTRNHPFLLLRGLRSHCVTVSSAAGGTGSTSPTAKVVCAIACLCALLNIHLLLKFTVH